MLGLLGLAPALMFSVGCAPEGGGDISEIKTWQYRGCFQSVPTT